MGAIVLALEVLEEKGMLLGVLWVEPEPVRLSKGVVHVNDCAQLHVLVCRGTQHHKQGGQGGWLETGGIVQITKVDSHLALPFMGCDTSQICDTLGVQALETEKDTIDTDHWAVCS